MPEVLERDLKINRELELTCAFYVGGERGDCGMTAVALAQLLDEDMICPVCSHHIFFVGHRHPKVAFIPL